MPIQAAFGNGSLRSFGVNVSPKKRIGANVAVTYLILAGGGGSSWQAAGASGGGGAGGLITGVQNTSGGVRLSVVVGAGGTGYQNGSNSSVTRYTLDEGVWTNIESAGGGGGGIELGDPSAPQAALPVAVEEEEEDFLLVDQQQEVDRAQLDILHKEIMVEMVVLLDKEQVAVEVAQEVREVMHRVIRLVEMVVQHMHHQFQALL